MPNNYANVDIGIKVWFTLAGIVVILLYFLPAHYDIFLALIILIALFYGYDEISRMRGKLNEIRDKVEFSKRLIEQYLGTQKPVELLDLDSIIRLTY